MGIFNVFQTGVSALYSNGQALSVASQNIANVNTPGYSRQEIVFESANAQKIGNIELGLGVSVKQVKRIYDQYAESRVVNAQMQNGEFSSMVQNLQQIESVFNDLSDDGLGESIQSFFSGFQELSVDPSSLALRKDVLEKADTLIDRFHTLDQSLSDAREFIDVDIQEKVDSINQLTSEIVDLNLKIKGATDDSDLVLRDKRTLKIAELAQYIDVTSVESSDGVFQVYAAQGIPLVNGASRGVLQIESDPGNDNLSSITFVVGSGTAEDITDRISGGALQGLLNVRDTMIPAYKDQLDELAYRISEDVNDLHSTGYGLDGVTSRDFFTSLGSSSNAARLLSFDAAIDDNPSAIATSGTAADLPGGNSIARQIADLVNQDSSFVNGNASYINFYGSFLGQIGSDSSNYQSKANFASTVLNQAQIQREKISGVSLDEEQISLIRFQSAFQASAKMIQSASEMLDQILQLQ